MVRAATLPTDAKRGRYPAHQSSCVQDHHQPLTANPPYRRCSHRDTASPPPLYVRSGSVPQRLHAAWDDTGYRQPVAARAVDRRAGLNAVVSADQQLCEERPMATRLEAVVEVSGVPLRLGDAVYWISDDGPEPGYVRWIGRLPLEDAGHDWMVGVEFKRPVGSGNGCYRGRRLFTARLNHASIVPIAGLMRAHDFDAHQDGLAVDRLAPVEEVAGRIAMSPRYLEQHTSDEEDPRSTRDQQQQHEVESCGRVTGHQFSDDLDNMTPFHQMAYLQLAGSAGEDEIQMQQSKLSVAAADSTQLEHSSSAVDAAVKHRRKLRHVLDFDRRRQKKADKLAAKEGHHVRDQVEEDVVYNPSAVSPGYPDLSVGSAVEVDVYGAGQYGVLRWIGRLRGDARRLVYAGVEMEEQMDSASDGSIDGVRYFSCPPSKAVFVPLSDVRQDRRFMDCADGPECSGLDGGFGSVDCPAVTGDVPPLSVASEEELQELCGKSKGIQGHLNSCYLDATLFSMFAFTPVLDCLLHRPKHSSDIPEYTEVQQLLKEEIVNPLRSGMYVRADRVMKLRRKLESLSSVQGLTSEEKDPEEFLQSLVAQILHADPFLRYSSGQESYLYQLIVEKDEQLSLPTVQQLFDQSFLNGDIKLQEIPSCLIIQMPRFGKDYKVYPRILPSVLLDVTDVLQDSPRQCCVCGALAEWECKQCFGSGTGLGLAATAFCTRCNLTTHGHPARAHHAKRQPLRVAREFIELREHAHIPRCFLELFAVVCIQTSHYVSFAKTGHGPDAVWVFFDSMADRKGEARGYNIPEVTPLVDLTRWMSDDGVRDLTAIRDDKLLPEHVRRLLCDSYMCFYQSRDVMMYR